jgi:DNA-binding protein H-NS
MKIISNKLFHAFSQCSEEQLEEMLNKRRQEREERERKER